MDFLLSAVLLCLLFWRAEGSLNWRQSTSDEILDFCYGEGSICEMSNDLYSQCDAFETGGNTTPYYQCLCSNGYVATHEACFWCQVAYDIDSYSDNGLKRQCASVKASIAPIPTSILRRESSYNATYTGPPPPSGPTPSTAKSGSITQDISDSFTPTASATTRDETSETSAGLGESTVVVTYDGGFGPTGAQEGNTPTASATDSAPTSTGAAGMSVVVPSQDAASWLFGILFAVIAVL